MINNTVQYFVLATLFLGMNLMLSCSSDAADETIIDPEPVQVNKLTFIANGGNFNSQVVSYTDFFEEGANVGYDSSIGATVLQVTGIWNNQPATLLARFPGKTTGLFEFRTTGEDFFPTETEELFLQVTSIPLYIKGATLQITEYKDSIGSYIKGNFFGTWEDVVNGKTVTIGSGQFELLQTF